MMRTVVMIAALLPLGLTAGCAQTDDTVPEPAPTCIANAYQDLVGGTEMDALDTLVDLLLLDDSPPEVRYVRPGEAITMDYRPERTNIALDAAGIVTRVYCG